MRSMKIIIKENCMAEDGFKILSAKDGSDITEHLLVKEVFVHACPGELTVAKLLVYAEVECEPGVLEVAQVERDVTG